MLKFQMEHFEQDGQHKSREKSMLNTIMKKKKAKFLFGIFIKKI